MSSVDSPGTLSVVEGSHIEATIPPQTPLNLLTRDVLVSLNLAVARSQGEELSVILRSFNPRSFVAGADIKDFASASQEGVDRFVQRGQLSLHGISASGNFLVVLNGHTLGGGAELALACEERVAMPDLNFGFPEVFLGVLPCYDGCQRLTDVVGVENAARLIVSGQTITAQQALNLGIVSRVIDGEPDIGEFVDTFNEGSLLSQGAQVHESSSIKLTKLERAVVETGQRNQRTFDQLSTDSGLSPDQIDNVYDWMQACYTARIRVLDVFRRQMAHAPVSDHALRMRRSADEAQAFVHLALSDEARKAMRFWVLEKKQHRSEHEFLKDHPELTKSGVELEL